jgi:hypothetical protein
MKTICVSQQEDGTFTVYEKLPEAAAPAMQGEVPAEQAAPETQAAATIDEALELVRQMLSQDARSPEEQVMAGYAKGAKPAAKQTPAQVFGEGI